jgi:hypothetical protein
MYYGLLIFLVFAAYFIGVRQGKRSVLIFLGEHSLPRLTVAAIEKRFGCTQIGDLCFLRSMKSVKTLGDLKLLVETWGERTIVRIAFLQYIAEKPKDEVRHFWPLFCGTPMFLDEWDVRFPS